MSFKVSGLYFYPVKSCAGIARTRLQIGRFGPELDRAWMVVDALGRFITQREVPELARIETAVDSKRLSLSTPAGVCHVPLDGKGDVVRIQIWRHQGPAIDGGDEAAQLLSKFLGRPARLVRLSPDHERQSAFGAQMSFTDTGPILVLSQASLDFLNKKLRSPLPMDRFRPNVVIEGGTAHQEDLWTRVRVGALVLDRAQQNARCSITTVDQKSGVMLGPEPLKTLATYRLKGQEVLFGCYYHCKRPGLIHVGDAVEPVGVVR